MYKCSLTNVETQMAKCKEEDRKWHVSMYSLDIINLQEVDWQVWDIFSSITEAQYRNGLYSQIHTYKNKVEITGNVYEDICIANYKIDDGINTIAITISSQEEWGRKWFRTAFVTPSGHIGHYNTHTKSTINCKFLLFVPVIQNQRPDRVWIFTGPIISNRQRYDLSNWVQGKPEIGDDLKVPGDDNEFQSYMNILRQAKQIYSEGQYMAHCKAKKPLFMPDRFLHGPPSSELDTSQFELRTVVDALNSDPHTECTFCLNSGHTWLECTKFPSTENT